MTDKLNFPPLPGAATPAGHRPFSEYPGRDPAPALCLNLENGAYVWLEDPAAADVLAAAFTEAAAQLRAMRQARRLPEFPAKGGEDL